jgi:predicted small secreted protein
VKRYLGILLVMCTVAAAAGCNTMEGLGKDLKALGSKLEKKAEEKK